MVLLGRDLVTWGHHCGVLLLSLLSSVICTEKVHPELWEQTKPLCQAGPPSHSAAAALC